MLIVLQDGRVVEYGRQASIVSKHEGQKVPIFGRRFLLEPSACSQQYSAASKTNPRVDLPAKSVVPHPEVRMYQNQNTRI